MQIKEKKIIPESAKKKKLYEETVSDIHAIWMKIEESIQKEEPETALEPFLPHNN